MTAENDSDMRKAFFDKYNITEEEYLHQQRLAREDWERRTGWLMREYRRLKMELSEKLVKRAEIRAVLSENKELDRIEARLEEIKVRLAELPSDSYVEDAADPELDEIFRKLEAAKENLKKS